MHCVPGTRFCARYIQSYLILPTMLGGVGHFLRPILPKGSTLEEIDNVREKLMMLRKMASP